LKTKLILILKFLVLVILYFVTFALITALVLPRLEQAPADNEPLSALTALLIVSFLNTAVLTLTVAYSQWSGLKLIVTLGLVLFGVITVMPQMETAVFVQTLPPGFLSRLFLAGFLFAAIFALFLVFILGNRQKEAAESAGVSMSSSQWLIRISLAALIYVFLYFTFGYFIAWQTPAVRAYYGGGELSGFLPQLQATWRATPWLFLFQFVRGLMWTGLAVLIIQLVNGKWWERALIVALIFSVVMNSQLLLPNPLMPYDVRMAHMLETASSNFLFGWLVVWLLNNKHAQDSK
jgi:hypothetical protein